MFIHDTPFMKSYVSGVPSREPNAYQVDETLIVKELNAAVLILTFKGSKGEVYADLYDCPHSGKSLVGAGSCPPVNAKFITTVTIFLK